MTPRPFPREILPVFNDIDPKQIKSTIAALLDKNRERLRAVLANNGPYTWDNLMQPIENMQEELSKAWSPIAHLHGVRESEELREAFHATLPLLTAYHVELTQNEALYQAVGELANSPQSVTLNPAQRKIIDNDLRDFKLAGVQLPADKKAKMKELQQQLSQLTTKFAENVLDATQHWYLHITDVNQLKGLPPQAVQLASSYAKQRNLTGYVFTLDAPSYSSAIEFLDDRKLRQTMYEAFTTRASDKGPQAGKWDNTEIMENIIKIRHDIAQLVGFDNYAVYALATKMAKTPEEVLHFLNDLVARSKAIALSEYKELCDFARAQGGITTLEPWDIPYYSNKLLKSTFNFSPEECRPYFPIDRVLNGLFAIVEKIYGLKIQEEQGIEVWHPQVRFFSIYDSEQQLRGGFYVDLYARPHKRDGAWMDECRTRYKCKDYIQLPVAYLTCNFRPPIDQQPALLTHDEVLVLFHEFGHCLHHLLTQVDYPSVAGINGVPWDAVEFPSQFMENFCWVKASLDLISTHYETHTPLPEDLYQNMVAAKNFQSALMMIRQLEYSIFDFRLHLEYDPTQSRQVQAMLNDVRQKVAVIQFPEFNRFQHSFSHIFAGSYAAGYYSYKWAEVLSADAYAQFEEHGVLDFATGQSFMHNILEVGGTRDPLDSFIAFRGRAPNIEALLRLNGMPT